MVAALAAVDRICKFWRRSSRGHRPRWYGTNTWLTARPGWRGRTSG